MMVAPDPRNFSQIALDFYQLPGVDRKAINLQDTFGLDVNCLLFALWAGLTAGRSVTEREWVDILQEIGSWNQEVVVPIRSVRRAVAKTEDSDGSHMKSAVLKMEIAAEMEQLRQMDRFSNASGAPPADQRQTALRNLIAYALAKGATDESQLRDQFLELVDLADTGWHSQHTSSNHTEPN